MQRLYIYSGALAVIGASLGGPAVYSLVAGDWGISIFLVAIGGCGMVLGAAYQPLRTDPDEFTMSTSILILFVGAACMSLLGTFLSIVSGV